MTPLGGGGGAGGSPPERPPICVARGRTDRVNVGSVLAPQHTAMMHRRTGGSWVWAARGLPLQEQNSVRRSADRREITFGGFLESFLETFWKILENFGTFWKMCPGHGMKGGGIASDVCRARHNYWSLSTAPVPHTTHRIPRAPVDVQRRAVVAQGRSEAGPWGRGISSDIQRFPSVVCGAVGGRGGRAQRCEGGTCQGPVASEASEARWRNDGLNDGIRLRCDT